MIIAEIAIENTADFPGMLRLKGLLRSLNRVRQNPAKPVRGLTGIGVEGQMGVGAVVAVVIYRKLPV